MIENTKKALEKHLSALTPSLSTAYEGVSFSPVNGTPYQRVQLVPSRPENPTLGDDYFRDNGEFQVFLLYPSNKGTGEVLGRAEALRSHFKRGTTLTEGNSVVQIMRTPYISGCTIIGDRVIVPVLIRYSVEAI
jgi:hypothetical protein